MNGIEKITQRIEADAQAEIDRILSEAREEADQITGRYKAQAEAEAASLAARNEKSAVEREERRLAGEGRVLVRASGTEALIRVMVEAKTEEIARQVAERLVERVKTL